MAEKIRNVEEIDSNVVQLQILKELKEINRSTLYSSYKENALMLTISMILTGLGGLIILSTTLFDWSYDDVVRTVPFGLGLAIIGIALYLGRSLFQYSYR